MCMPYHKFDYSIGTKPEFQITMMLSWVELHTVLNFVLWFTYNCLEGAVLSFGETIQNSDFFLYSYEKPTNANCQIIINGNIDFAIKWNNVEGLKHEHEQFESQVLTLDNHNNSCC